MLIDFLLVDKKTFNAKKFQKCKQTYFISSLLLKVKERGLLANGTLICIMKQFIGFSIPVTKALIIAIISYNSVVAIFLLTSAKKIGKF